MTSGSELRFRFRGKSRKLWNLKVTDRRIAKVVHSCQDLPGQHLFQYEDQAGEVRQISSADVNDYIRSIAGPEVSERDFRTWVGTMRVASALTSCEPGSDTANRRTIREAIATVATQLGNTPAICRKCYVHPEVLAAYIDGDLQRAHARSRKLKRVSGLSVDEALTLSTLTTRKWRALRDR